TQLDWIMRKSRHRLFLVDPEQTVRPADLPRSVLTRLIDDAKHDEHYVRLWTQMRVASNGDYVGYVRAMLSDEPPTPRRFDPYEFRLFDSFPDLWEAIRAKEECYGLSRLVAGYAWEWKTKKHPTGYDIELDGCRLRWNSKDKDWISQPGSIEEVGSIHTVQGYDLNYAGVVLGPDLRFDQTEQRIIFHRESYRDPKGMENNKMRGITYRDADILGFVRNIYAVLLTRGIRGTYVYVCDPPLRSYLRGFIEPQ
ncbi:MAG: DNA/RNA helicase domain-containing protein, partial [Acidimicrobiales bacterium]